MARLKLKSDCPTCPPNTGVAAVLAHMDRSPVVLGAHPSHDFGTGLRIAFPESVSAFTGRTSAVIYRHNAIVRTAERVWLVESDEWSWLFEEATI